MRAKEYGTILDSLQTTAVYVIREDDHTILYYNKRLKEVIPDVREGLECHAVVRSSSCVCDGCPLLRIDGRQEAHVINYDARFGGVIEITATRILWENTIPAFTISITPRAEMANYVYHKVLWANLTENSFSVIKADEEELQDMREHMLSLSDWFEGVAQGGYVYKADIKRYREFAQIEQLREKLKEGAKRLNCIYRRKTDGCFRWHTLEIVRDANYTDDNQRIMIYVKDVHDLFEEGLKREETNIQNQEIIAALGEENFAVYVLDLQSGIVNIIKATEKIRNTVKSDSFLWASRFTEKEIEYIAAEDRKEFENRFSLHAMQQAWKDGEKKRRYVCKAFLYNEWRYISISAFFKENLTQGGYAVLAFQDVDEQTKKDMESRQNDKRMAAIIKSRYSVLNTVDLETGVCERIYLEKKDMSGRMVGDYEENIQKALADLVAEADKEKFRDALSIENIRKKAESVQDFKEEICQYRHKGTPVMWIEEHVLYIRQDDRITVNILGRDITSEKLAEEQARKELEEKAAIIGGMSSMFFATYYFDFENDSFRPVTQKEEVGSVLGNEKSCAQIIKLYAENFVCEEDREEYLEYINIENLTHILSKDHPFGAVEYRMLPDENNHTAWIRATVVLLDTTVDGRPGRALYVAQDVTESKRKEEQERQALREACEAANHANEAKSEFMSRMSHDIRTPMNAIIGMTAIAGTHLDDRERMIDCLNKITVSSKHLLSLINEVLDMSKIESGKIELAEEEINLSDLIENLVAIIRPSMQEKNHNLTVRIANVEHERVIGDPVRLQQIFMNILGNAVKYTLPGGNIQLEIGEKPSKTYGYGYYEFIFSDDGMGMSKEFLEKIFEPFSREENPHVNKIEGTGLGMAIVRNIARKMNGDIVVESELGKGSQFTVLLPLQLLDTAEPDMERFANLPVLVADDDETAGEMACMILGNIGMKGEYVVSGREAVERVWQHHQKNDDYFVVILDWKMPDMDGVATVKAIREKVGRDVPIIILSAYDWSEIEEEARSVGVNGFISKPLFRSRLLYLFNQILGEDNGQEQQESQPFDETLLTGKRILLVDDIELNREIAEEIIAQTGIVVECAENGKEALEKFEKMPENYYDMIFMDIQMPVMNGYDATAAIRKLSRRDAAGIPIIAMTADAFAEDIRKSKKAGMNEHLTKPLDIGELMKCLEKWLGGDSCR